MINLDPLYPTDELGTYIFAYVEIVSQKGRYLTNGRILWFRYSVVTRAIRDPARQTWQLKHSGRFRILENRDIPGNLSSQVSDAQN